MTVALTETDIQHVSMVTKVAAECRNLKSFEQNVLAALRECFGLSVSSLSIRHHERVDVPDHVTYFGGLPDATMSFNRYYRHLANPYRNHIYSACAGAGGEHHVIDTQGLFTQPPSSALYNKFQRPMGMDRSLVIVLWTRAEGRIMLGLWRRYQDDAFGNVDLAKARLLTPGLAAIYARLREDEYNARFAYLMQVLEPSHLTAPVLLLDSRREVTFLNRAARLVLMTKSGNHGKTSLPTPLATLCDAALRANGASECMRFGYDNWVVTATPVPKEFSGGFILQFASSFPAGNIDQTLREHGLTRRETDVVRLAARGLTAKELARQLDISTFTVQDYMKSIYRKLNVKNRVCLSNLLNGTP